MVKLTVKKRLKFNSILRRVLTVFLTPDAATTADTLTMYLAESTWQLDAERLSMDIDV